MLTANQVSLTFLALGLSLISLPAKARIAPQLGGVATELRSTEQPFIQRSSPIQHLAKNNRKRFVPPKIKRDRGIPTSGRSHNASRSGCQAQPDQAGITLLVPEYVDSTTNSRGQLVESRYAVALSATPQPVFWAYVPADEKAEEVSLEFVLQDAEGQKLYRKMLAPPAQSGMMRIELEAMPALEAGVDYHWFLKQKSSCVWLNDQVRDSGEAIVRYVEPSTVRETDGETGYWHDALEAASGNAEEFGALVEAIGLSDLL